MHIQERAFYNSKIIKFLRIQHQQKHYRNPLTGSTYRREGLRRQISCFMLGNIMQYATKYNIDFLTH